MEAYRMQSQRSFDPMSAFLGGGDCVSASLLPPKSKNALDHCSQLLPRPNDKKDKSSSKQ
jgi:hypothetical protein